MLEADQIVDLLTVAGALALVAVPIMALMLVWAIRTAWRLMCNLRDEETEHAWTRRRLEDVEALRKGHITAVNTADHRLRVDHILEEVEVNGLRYSLPFLAGGIVTGDRQWVQIKRAADVLTVHSVDLDGMIEMIAEACDCQVPHDLIRTHLGDPPFEPASLRPEYLDSMGDLEGRN